MGFCPLGFCPHGILSSGIFSSWDFFLHEILSSWDLSEYPFRRREYQRLLGLLNFAAPLCKIGRLHMRLVIRDAPRFPKVHHRSPRRSCSARVSPSLRAHLLWWTRTTNLLRPVPLSPPTPTLTIWTDASDSGWGGASSLNDEIWGVWSQAEVSHHINAKECMAVLRVIQCIRPPKASALLVRSDNMVAVAWINRQGSSTSKRLNTLAIKLQPLCLLHQWTIRASYNPGPQNTWADSLSRGHFIPSEFVLAQESFHQLLRLQSLQVDLFAHPGNARLPVFGCPFRHPRAAIHDALTADWNRWDSIYLFPPPALIPVCLR